MATFHLIEPYKDYSGKTCKHSNIINCLGRTGVRRDKQWTTQICHPRTSQPSTAETAVRERFKAVRLMVKAIKNDGDKYLDAANDFQAVKNQYKSFDSYLWSIAGAEYDASLDE